MTTSRKAKPLTTPIDVWNLTTFDEELLALLQAHGEVLRNYELTNRENYEDQQAADGWVPLKDNPFASDRMHILEQIIMPVMEQRTIRAWHYTRLTDAEVELLKANGIPNLAITPAPTFTEAINFIDGRF